MRSFSIWMAFLWLTVTSCNAQSSSPFAPEAGTYSGSSTGVTASYQYGYNAITGFGMQPSSQINVMPSPLGEMVISHTGANKGNYSFPKSKGWNGTWTFDPATNRLAFTGQLKDKLAQYKASKGFYSISLKLGTNAGDKEGVLYTYSKKATKPFPKPEAPNGPVTGQFTVMPDGSSIAYYNANGKTEHSFHGQIPSTNRNHRTLTVGYTNDPHYYQLSIADPGGSSTVFTPEKIRSWNLKFHDYKLGAFAEDNNTIALLGKTHDNYANLTYTPGEFVIAVIDTKTGTARAYLPTMENLWIKPSFLPGGGLVYSPREGGIAITNAGYKNMKIIYPNPVNALALSPDGKQVAFSEGLFFYTMNIDGSNKKQIICGNEPLQVTKGEEVTDMCWSPDGKYVAFGYGPSMAYNIVIVPLDGKDYRFLNDPDGEPMTQKNPVVSWH